MTTPSSTATARPHERLRDADRSRSAILDAAEALFADHGYDATSLQGIATAAGLSRGTPSYFYGSKQALYTEVLDRAFARRQAATHAALAPLRQWCAGTGGREQLQRAVSQAVEGYLRFLGNDPRFARLILQEELTGGERLSVPTTTSTAMTDAFSALRQVGAARGIREFDVDDAILVFIGLTFTPASYQHTLMRSIGRDLARPRDRRRQVALAVSQLMHLIAQ
ncbi:MAG: TetR/AcrR family transcriptional regulator [Solirubrobacteraceae bacterium]